VEIRKYDCVITVETGVRIGVVMSLS
jgi:hypothetical protein